MPATFRNSSPATASSNSVSVTAPSGAVSGDYQLVVVHLDTATETMNALPSGSPWTLALGPVASGDPGNADRYYFYESTTAGADTFTLGKSAAGLWATVRAAWSNTSGRSSPSLISQQNTTASTSLPFPPITPPAGDQLVVVGIGQEHDSTAASYTAPTNYTRQVNVVPTATGVRSAFGMAERAVSNAAAQSGNWTSTLSDEAITWSFVLGPAAPATLPIHASTPAVVDTTSNPATTAAFTPPADALLLSFLGFDTNLTPRTGTTSTVTGSTSAWTKVRDRSTGDGAVSISWAKVSSSVSTTVRGLWDAPAASPGSTALSLYVPVIPGAEVVQSGDLTIAAGGAQTVSITRTREGSRVLFVHSSYDSTVEPTPPAGVTQLVVTGSTLYGYGVWASGDLADGSNSFAFNFDSASVGASFSWVEVAPPVPVPTHTSTLTATAETTAVFGGTSVVATPKPPAFGNAGNALAYNSTARTSSIIPVPANIAANDIVLVMLYTETAVPTITLTASTTGFAPLSFSPVPGTTTSGSINHQSWFWRRATGPESTNYTFSHNSVKTEGIAFRVTGAQATGTPVELYNTTGSAVREGNATATVAVSGTTGGDNRLLIWGATTWETVTITAPTNWTRQFAGSDSAFAWKTQPVAGPTGSISGTQSVTGNSTAVVFGILPAIVAVIGDLTATAAASTSIGATTIDRVATLAATSASSTALGAPTFTRPATSTATAASTAAIGSTAFVKVERALTATAAATTAVRAANTSRVTATAATSTVLTGDVGAIRSTATAAVVITGKLLITRTLASTAAARTTVNPSVPRSYTLTARAASSAINLGVILHHLRKTLALDFGVTGTIAPLPERISTVQVRVESTGAPTSITGMDGRATLAFSGNQSVITLGPPGRFSVDVSVLGRISFIAQLIETVPVTTSATGNLRVVQSLTTILENGLPALITDPARTAPPPPEPEPEPVPEPVSAPVYDRTFFNLRR